MQPPGLPRARWTASATGSQPTRQTRPRPSAGRRRTYLLAGFDEYFLGYKDRGAVVDPVHVGKISPGANGVFRPLIVTGGQIVGTWDRAVRGQELTIGLRPFDAEAADVVRAARPEAARYRDFLGLAAGAEPVLNADP